MKEKCSKCLQWKERSEFTKLQMGSKPRCIACIEKKAKIEELKGEIERVSANLSMMKLELQKLNNNYIPKEPQREEEVRRVTKVVKSELRMHPKHPLGMKRKQDAVWYYSKNGMIKWGLSNGRFGKYVKWKDMTTGEMKTIGLDKLRREIFGNDSRLGI